VQCLSSRLLPVPVLRLESGSDLRPSGAAFARGPHRLGECRYRLLALQSEKGQQIRSGREYAPESDALCAKRGGSPSQWPEIPAQPSASELDGLSLLGYRAGTL